MNVYSINSVPRFMFHNEDMNMLNYLNYKIYNFEFVGI